VIENPVIINLAGFDGNAGVLWSRDYNPFIWQYSSIF